MEQPMKERRRFPRLKIELFVRYKILGKMEQQGDGQTKNISAGGICLVAREKLQLGTKVAVEMKFPDSVNPVLAVGRVVWSDESNLGPSIAGHPRFDNGIEFEQISVLDRNRIIEHVKFAQDKTKGHDWQIGIVTDIAR